MKFIFLKRLINIFNKFFLILLFLILLILSKSFADNFKLHAKPIEKPIQTRISSDIIDIKKKSQKIDFINNVIVERQDFSMLAKKMTVYYFDNKIDDNSTNKNSSIKVIKAYENIKLFNNEFTAKSDVATFEPDKNIIILEKNVMVNNGTSVIKGDKFIYDVNLKKSQVFGQKNLKNLNEKIDERVTIIIGDDIKDTTNNFKK